MFDVAFPPAFIMILGAILIGVARPGLRPAIFLLTPLLTLFAIWQVPDSVQLSAHFLGYDIQLMEGSKVRRMFATVFALMAFASALFSLKQAKVWEMAAGMAYAAGAIGVSFAGDLIVMFVFWELMALFSTVMVWSGGTEAARRAGIRYVTMHMLGGILLMIGIEGVMVHTGSVEIRPLALDTVDAWIVLIGILVNAAAPPISHWLSDAYPESSPTGGVWLSAFTTKTAVLALILLFPGQPILIAVGLWMIFYGIIYALLENDMRRVLSYSIVNQVGFMVCGIGIGTEMAINGAAAHAFAHIIYKALLFMSAGSVLYMTGKRKLTELGGLFQSMPLTTICGCIGALSISAFPFTSGFVSKSMISAAAADERMTLVYFLLMAASAGVFAGIKFPWFVFFQRDSGLRPPDPPWNMRAAMVLFAALCIVLGLFPGPLYAGLPYPVEFVPYTAGHVVTQLQLLLFAGLAFLVVLPLMKRAYTITLDFDWFYRHVGTQLAVEFRRRVLQGWRELVADPHARYRRLIGRLTRTYGPQGPLAKTWPTGSMVLWVAILLTAYLVLDLL